MSNEISVEAHYNVIIDSIGTANASVAGILSEVLGTPVEIIAKALYNAPSIIFSNTNEDLAEKTVELMTRLGMQCHFQDSEVELISQINTVDIGVYIHNLDALTEVTKKLADFLGCHADEAIQLLMNDPAIVLGNVSEATGNALKNRLNEEVIISNPKTDLYTLVFSSDNKMIRNQLENYLKYIKVDFNFDNGAQIENLDYHISLKIWTKFQSTGMLKMINQSFQRFEIILTEVDQSNPNYRIVLTDQIGMPDEIIDEIIDNLPIQLNASINQKNIADKINNYSLAGLTTESRLVKENSFKLIIEQNGNLNKSKEILSQFIIEDELPKTTGRWEAPVAIGDLLFRCISTQLESINCTVDYDYI